MTRIPISEAAEKLLELSELAFAGETFELLKEGRVVALLAPPVVTGKAKNGAELARRIREWPRMSPAEAEAFALDVEAAIREGNKPGPEIEWPS